MGKRSNTKLKPKFPRLKLRELRDKVKSQLGLDEPEGLQFKTQFVNGDGFYIVPVPRPYVSSYATDRNI